MTKRFFFLTAGRIFFISALTLLADTVCSQTTGGSFDGFGSQAAPLQSLNGGTLSAVKYHGGSFDGFASTSVFTNVNPDFALQKFFGGSFDGFAASAAVLSLDNGFLFSKYFGGSYDGFASRDVFTNLGGTFLSSKYFGGSFDGFASIEVFTNPGGTFLSSKYFGGSFDGFAASASVLSLDNGFLFSKYFGGSYDGFASAIISPQDVPLPVSLLSFTLTPAERGILLRWKTASETDNAGFLILRSLRINDADTASTYEPVASYETVSSLRGKGSSATESDYTYTDFTSLQAGTRYSYQLLSVDFSGVQHLYESRSVVTPFLYTLAQNYPNPFNPQTTILFSLAEDAVARLDIFNVLGQRLTTLVNEPLRAGRYTYQWNASSYSSGTYFYRLTSNGFTQTHKMLLVK